MEVANDRIGVRPIYGPDDNVSGQITNTHVHIVDQNGDHPLPALCDRYKEFAFGPTDRLKITVSKEYIFITSTEHTPNQALVRILEAKIAAGDAKPRSPAGPLIEIQIRRT